MTLRGMALTRRGGGPSGTMIIDFVFRFDSDSISDYVNYSTRSKAVCKPYGHITVTHTRRATRFAAFPCILSAYPLRRSWATAHGCNFSCALMCSTPRRPKSHGCVPRLVSPSACVLSPPGCKAALFSCSQPYAYIAV